VTLAQVTLDGESEKKNWTDWIRLSLCEKTYSFYFPVAFFQIFFALSTLRGTVVADLPLQQELQSELQCESVVRCLDSSIIEDN
jgi:hypothetical protein